ncbi:ABC transporter substrate-binding protein [Pantoea sp. B65]|uniref:ABC transporter substrate-binding protein n=1 Tax=Pantoea sp. B65 TaxID=2813359 RepID=UPI0039B47056
MSRLCLSFACLASAAAMGAEKQIRFGTDPTFPPFESRSASGELQGFDIDLGNAICAHLQAKCIWTENTFDGLIPALKARKFDAILSSLSITDERKKSIDFSDKLFNTPAYLVAAKGSALTAAPATLQGKHIGVQQGSVFEVYALKHWRPAGAEVISYPSADAVYADLVAGRLDATLDDATVVTQSLLSRPQGKGFTLIEQVKDEAIFGPGTGIGVRKGDEVTLAQFNQAISAIRADGTYDRLAKKYFNFNIYGD